MADKIDLPDIGSLANSSSARAAINSNFNTIENAIDNTLSRDGSTPNQMEADIDLNGNSLLNVADPVNDMDGVNKRSVGDLVEGFVGEIAETIIQGTARSDRFIATAGQSNFTLTDSPGTELNMYVFDNGIAMTPNLDFHLTGTDLKTLSFFSPRALDAEIVCRYVQLSPADGLLRADLGNSVSTKGASLVAYKRVATGATERTVTDKLSDSASLFDFFTAAQIADVLAGTLTLDVSTAVQAAITWAAANKRALYAPGGAYRLDTGLSHSSGSLALFGDAAGTNGSRFHIKGNDAAFHFTSEGTLRDIGIIGEQDGAKTLQVGVLIEGTNNVDLDGVVISACYDNIQIKDVAFYLRFTRLRMFSCVRNQIRGYGVGAAGYAFDFTDSLITPAAGDDTYYFENAGSINMCNIVASPANATGYGLRIVSNASAAGLHQFTNCVFEGSTKEALRIEGTAPAPVNFVHFANCYFNQSGSGYDAITLIYTRDVAFSNCYISGTGGGVDLAASCRDTKLSNCEFQVNGTTPIIRVLTSGVVVNGLHVTNPTYAGTQRFLDVSATAAANLDRIHIQGGYLGSHATPVLMPASAGAKVKVNVVGNTQTRNGGNITGNGGASLYAVAHGLVDTPRMFGAVSNSPDAGNAEIREVTVDASNIYIQCKASAAAGTNNVKFQWWAEA